MTFKFYFVFYIDTIVGYIFLKIKLVSYIYTTLLINQKMILKEIVTKTLEKKK